MIHLNNLKLFLIISIENYSKKGKNLLTLFQSLITFQANRRSDDGTCKGDSGAPLLMEKFNGDEITIVQVGILHGGAEECSNKRFPAIFNRLSNPSIFKFVFREIFSTNQTSVKGKKLRLKLPF